MTNDVKLGLVLGLGVVLAVAVTFYAKEVPANGATESSSVPAQPNAVRGTVPPARVRTADPPGRS
jgi:hypothetical protein